MEVLLFIHWRCEFSRFSRFLDSQACDSGLVRDTLYVGFLFTRAERSSL